MADVIFEDFSVKVIDAIDDTINAALEEAAGELEAQVKRNTRVDTGQTKNSFRHAVDDSKHIAYVGSNHENAIWEEFGTGEHALNNDGRKGGWVYKDAKGEYHYTTGKKPSRAFFKAYTTKKTALINIIQSKLKGM